MKLSINNYKRYLLLLIIISTVIRGLLAAALELGNDEVYYRLYALYPDWSHFDHPMMVGIVMQIFSLNMLLQSEFFLRLGPVIIGAINIWLMFRLGSLIKNERTGFFAALLYTASIYATVITGIFILPDTPQSLFWLLGIYLMMKVLPGRPGYKKDEMRLLLLGLVLGLGILSKYTTVFLWLGIALEISLFKRVWFKNKAIYYALLISLICVVPILIWNYQNDFISFTFHGSRLEMTDYEVNFNYFFREIVGEFLYNNPVNFILIVIGLIAVIQDKLEVNRSYQAIIVFSTLPLIVSFLIFSMSRETLPHWSAPAYTTLVLIAAAWLDQQKNKTMVRGFLISALSFTGIILLAGYLQINHGIINLDGKQEYHRVGKNDPSLDMFGYRQTGIGFGEIVEQDIASGEMPEDIVFFGDNWFPLANYDYYAAYPLHMKSFGISDLDHLHKYAWINEKQGGFKIGMSGYYITDSKYYHPPNYTVNRYFETVEVSDTIQIYRSGKIVKRAFVWKLNNMVELPEDPFAESK